MFLYPEPALLASLSRGHPFLALAPALLRSRIAEIVPSVSTTVPLAFGPRVLAKNVVAVPASLVIPLVLNQGLLVLRWFVGGL